MALVLLLARLLLAVVFLCAGLAKLADLPGSQQAISDLGVPLKPARQIGIALPICEIVLAVALVFRSLAWWAALGTLGLLFVFTASISYQLALGREPSCHCFGRLHSAPSGPLAFARNGLLVLIATLVVCFGHKNAGLSATHWLTAGSLARRVALVVVVIAVALVAGESWLLLRILRQQGRLLLRIEDMESQLAQPGLMAETPGQEHLMVDLSAGRKAPAFSDRDLERV